MVLHENGTSTALRDLATRSRRATSSYFKLQTHGSYDSRDPSMHGEREIKNSHATHGVREESEEMSDPGQNAGRPNFNLHSSACHQFNGIIN